MPDVSAGGGKFVQRAINVTTAQASGTTLMPEDDTLPQNTEGTEFITQAITPLGGSNRLLVRANLFFSVFTGSAAYCIAALFRDSAADALAVGRMPHHGINQPIMVPVLYDMAVPAVGVETTFKLRGGMNVGSTTYHVNGNSSGRLFGASSKSFLEIVEYVP